MRRQPNVQTGFHINIHLLRRVIYGLILLLLFLLQSTPGVFPHIGDARASLVIPALVCLSMFERETVGAYFGLGLGLLWDSISTEVPGFHSILLMATGCLCGLLITHLMRNNLLAAFALSAAALFVHGFLYWFFYVVMRGYEGATLLFVRMTLPSMLYSLVFTPVFYYCFRAMHKRLRQNFSR